jgi:1,4-alpha-glucan branching enzyme
MKISMIRILRPSRWNIAMACGRASWILKGIKAGSRYKFVFRKNGQWCWRIDPAARNTQHSGIFAPENHGYVEYTGHPWPPFRTPSFENLIIYQLHIGSFAGFSDDFAGQVVDQTATFKMIESKLGYIRDLGFNAIQLLPVQEYRMNRSWGYDPSFFFAIESAYGTPEDLRNFVAEAHRHELAVLFDVVYNHATRDESNNSASRVRWIWRASGKLISS